MDNYRLEILGIGEKGVLGVDKKYFEQEDTTTQGAAPHTTDSVGEKIIHQLQSMNQCNIDAELQTRGLKMSISAPLQQRSTAMTTRRTSTIASEV